MAADWLQNRMMTLSWKLALLKSAGDNLEKILRTERDYWNCYEDCKRADPKWANWFLYGDGNGA